MGYNSFLNMGRKSLDIDYKSLFTKNLKIMSFTFRLQNYEKNLEKPNFFKGKKVKRLFKGKRVKR